MKPKLQLRVQRYGWNRAAHVYDQAWSRQLAPAQELLLRMANLLEGEKVLEQACGSGLVTLRIAEAVGPKGEVLATDLSEEMLEHGRKRVEDVGLENVIFRRMNAEAMDVPAGAFDASLCALGLMYVPDPGAALNEMARVLRPGGRAVAAVWGERSRCGWADIFPIVDARVETDVCPLFFQLGTGDTLRSQMEDAGFREVECERLSTTLSYPSSEAAVEAAFAGGPVAMAYSRFDESTRL